MMFWILLCFSFNYSSNSKTLSKMRLLSVSKLIVLSCKENTSFSKIVLILSHAEFNAALKFILNINLLKKVLFNKQKADKKIRKFCLLSFWL